MTTPSGHTNAIRAERVIGTDVKDMNGNTIGKVEDIVLEKMDNKIMFAVIGFGGVLGIGEKYHPVPWAVLDYDPSENAFIVPYTKDQLEQAPAETINELTKDDGQWARNTAYDYYKVHPYWN